MISPERLSSSALLHAGGAGDYQQLLIDGPHDPRISRQFRRLVDNIMRDFPRQDGGILMFAGVGSSGHIADVAGQVARQLALVPDSDVLLVDADAEQRVLTHRFAAVDEPGLSEALQEQSGVATAILPSVIRNLRFLPFGGALRIRSSASSRQMKLVLAELKSRARYVIVSTGAGWQLLHALAGRHSDGTYLVVQMGAADQQATTELASRLTASGARLLGCVATGVA